MRKIVVLLAVLLAPLAAFGQTVTRTLPLIGTPAAPITATNPMPISGSFSATVSGFAPGAQYATPLAVSNVSGNVALPTGTVVAVYNVGATSAYCKLGTSGVTATTANDFVPSNSAVAYTVGANTFIACITASSTTTVNLSGGAGLLTGFGGGGSGGGGGSNAAASATGSAVPPNASYTGLSVAGTLTGQTATSLSAGAIIAGQVDLRAVGGTAIALGQTTMAASIPVAIASNQGNVPVSQGTASALNATVVGAGSAGTANAGVVTVQGITSMTPVQVSQATAASLNATIVGTGTFAVQATLNSTPSLVNGNGVVPTQGGAVLSATNGGFTNVLQGNAVLSATNGLFSNLLQGNVVLSATNGLFVAPTTAATWATTQSTSPWIVAGGGTAGSAGTAVLTVQGIASMTPMLVNPGTAANWAVAATGAAVPANAQYVGMNVSGTLTGLLGTAGGLSVNTAQVNGVTVLTGTGAVSTGAQRVAVGTDVATIAGSAPGTAGTASTNVVSVQGIASMTPILANPGTIGTWGLQVATQNSATPTNMALVAGQFNTTPTGISSGSISALQLDTNGNLLVNIKAGAGSGGTAITDNTAFTQGSTSVTPVGGEYVSGGAGNCTTGNACGAQITIDRMLYTNLGKVGGTAIALGQTTMSASLPVTIASNQTAIGTVNPTTIATWGLMVGTTPATAPTNTLVVGAIYNSSAPAPTTGQTLPLQTDASGNLKVNVSTGASGFVDNTAFTFGTTPTTVAACEYATVQTNLTSGNAGAAQCTIDRNLYVNVNKWAGTALGAPSNYGTSPGTVAVIGVNAFVTNFGTGTAGSAAGGVVTVQGVASMTPILANPGTAASWGVQTQGSTTSGQSGVLIQGAVTTAAPTYTTAQTSPLSLDTSGSLRVNVVSGSTGNAAASNTGSAVPAQADYQGINVAGTLRGQTGSNPSGTIYAAQMDIVAYGGATLSTSNPIPVTGVGLASGATTSGTTGSAVMCATTTSITGGTTGTTNWLNCTPAGALRMDLSTVAGTAIALGQTTMSASLPVTIASNQSALTVAQATAASLNATVVGTGTFAVQATLNTTPTIANGNGVVPTIAGAVYSATNGAYTNILQGNAVLTTGNPLFVQLTAGAAAIGSVTANAGTNLNTSALALETGGNLATIAGSITASVSQANVKQINGVVPLMGNGVTGTGSQRVTIASDNTAFSVNATLSAETTKVIGTVNQGTSPWIVAGGGTAGSAATGVVTVQGIASMTPMLVNPGTIATWGYSVGTVPATAPTNTLITGGIYNVAAPTPSTGQTLPFQLDASGNLNVNIKAGAGSGGTALADGATFTEASTSFTPVGGEYIVSAANCTTGKGCTMQMTIDRMAYVNVGKINGVVPLMGNGVTGTGSQRVTIASDNTAFAVNATLTAETTKVIGTVNQGTSPWIVAGGGTAGTAATGVATVQGIASMTPLLVNPGTAANFGVGATGSAIPANGIYNSINVAGTLRGATGVNPSGSVFAQQMDLASAVGTTLGVNNGTSSAGTIRVNIASDNSAVSGLGAGATGAAVPANAVYQGVIVGGNLVGMTPGTAGAASTQVWTVQGAASMTKLLVTPDSVALPANQSVNVSQINAVTPLMGNGVTGTGSQRVTIASDNTAFAVNATLSAETTKVIGTARVIGNAGAVFDAATGAAVPANAIYMGARSGANLTGLIQADTSVAINVSTATTTQLVALSGSTKIYVTSFDVIAGGTGNITFEYGTGTACATGTTTLTGAYPLTAQSGIAKGGGLGPILVVPAGNALCVLTSQAVQMSGSVSYTQF